MEVGIRESGTALKNASQVSIYVKLYLRRKLSKRIEKEKEQKRKT